MINRKVEDPFEVVVKVTPTLTISVSKRKLAKKVRKARTKVKVAKVQDGRRKRRKRLGRPPGRPPAAAEGA